LGAVLGYDKIPAYWKMGLAEAEPLDFKYTNLSLNEVYDIGYKHALQNLKRNGGKETAENVTILSQTPEPVRFEKSFDGLYPVEKRIINKSLKDEYTFTFDGTGYVIRAEMAKWGNENDANLPSFKAEVYVDDKLLETVDLPVNYTTRRHEMAWNYQLPKQKHTVRLKLLNPDEKYHVHLQDVILYSDQPAKIAHQ
jgi:hypothetical protein